MLARRTAENGNFLKRRFPFSLYAKAGENTGNKPFKTYQELVKKLRDKNMVIEEDEEAKVISLLKKYSYFSLVSGYKGLFKALDGNYFPGATIDDVFAFYSFDDELWDVFFHATSNTK